MGLKLKDQGTSEERMDEYGVVNIFLRDFTMRRIATNEKEKWEFL
jgi:hypothetical protein